MGEAEGDILDGRPASTQQTFRVSDQAATITAALASLSGKIEVAGEAPNRTIRLTHMFLPLRLLSTGF